VPLKDTLDQLNKAAREKPNPTVVLARWRDALAELYKIVLSNLDNYIKENLIQPAQTLVTRSEEYLGSYEIAEIHLRIGNEAIILTPIGANIIGAHGRVDIYRRGYASTRCVLLWNGKATNAAGWSVMLPYDDQSKNPRRYSKQLLEEVIDYLLNQK
jgi:hypothetical protein